MEMSEEQSAEFLEFANYHRGKLITEFSQLEKAIEYFLANYFLRSTENLDFTHEFYSIILDRLTFEAKRSALRSVVDKHSIKNGFKKTKNNKYPHSKLFDSIRKINDHRVYFSHYILAMPVEFDPNVVIALVEFRDSVSVKTYSLGELHKLYNEMTDLRLQVIKLSEEIKPT